MNEPTMETLTPRLDRVERENRILKWAVVGVLVLGMGVPVAAHEVGWVLLTPPSSITEEKVEDTAPLSKWEPEKAFDTAKECEAYKEDMTNRVRTRWEEAHNVRPDNTAEADKLRTLSMFLTLELGKYSVSRCVPASTVYPQLKER